uniref:Xylulose 5-phosphate/phosphate translocator, chloroplastic n=1 Tax=Elaeis guineensis var. tenera TaxID=51953 RepID=A0A6I9RUX5_ELAGV|nr:xylulose 5-phosphate/phosphate translocator, chloroplastic [Elaeis guineensis]
MLSLHTPLPFSSTALLGRTKTHNPRHHATPNSTLTNLHALVRLPPSVLLQRPTLTFPSLIPRAAAADGDHPIAPIPKENQEDLDDSKDGEDSIPDQNEANEDNDDDEEEEDEDEEEENSTRTKDSITKSVPKNESKSKTNTLNLALVVGLWYFHSVIFNIYNKKVLNLFPYPWLLASFQLLVASLWMGFLWASRLQSFPRVSKKFFAALLGPAFFHAIGHVYACVSFSKVAVSFTHVIKTSEPVFSVVLSALHGRFYPLHVWLSVLPIVAGCSLAAVTEASFDAHGLWTALISNAGFVLRNIHSKHSLYDFSHVSGLNLYGWITIVSLLYLFPVAVFVEGSRWAGGVQRALAAVPTPWTFYGWVLLSGVFYHLYNQTSHRALEKMSSSAFSVGNSMKRVVVIVASVLVFGNPIRPLNALGSGIAILGTFLYSRATATEKKDNKAVSKTKTS